MFGPVKTDTLVAIERQARQLCVIKLALTAIELGVGASASRPGGRVLHSCGSLRLAC
jgi:hypothetical protein